jgi:hypothetical protein
MLLQLLLKLIRYTETGIAFQTNNIIGNFCQPEKEADKNNLIGSCPLVCYNYSKQQVSQNGTTLKTRFADNRKAIIKKLMTYDFANTY